MAGIFSQEMREEQESVLTDHRMIERDKFIIYSAGYFTKKEVQLYKELVRICLGILCLSLVAQDQAMWIQRRWSVKCYSLEVKREYTAGTMGEWGSHRAGG